MEDLKLQIAFAWPWFGLDCNLTPVAHSQSMRLFTMESMMIRLLLVACLALAAILLLQSDISATGYQAHATTRVAQDESGKAQTAPAPSTSDTDSSDDSGTPAKDQE
jgi:hypothetical protein